MTINISIQDVAQNLHPKITVLGVGGSGGNAVNNMINANLEGVDFLIANTDAQALQISKCPNKIQIGLKSTKGLGAGMRPDVGKQAAEEAIEEIKEKREQRYYDKRMKVKKVQEKYQAKLDIKQNIHLVEPDVVRSKAQVNEAEKMQIVDTRKAATGSSRRRSARK